MIKSNRRKKITKGLFFEVRITSRYINLMGSQIFEKLNINISFEEFLIMDILSYNEGICPRDLAKMLMRDRSNLGKIIKCLEQKKLVKIKPAIRNNRSIKKLYITEKSESLCNEIYEKLKPYLKIFNNIMKKNEQEMITKYLQNCRKVINNIVKTKI